MNHKQDTHIKSKTPRLRFPEFENAGEWEEKKLGEVMSFLSTATNSRADLCDSGNLFYIHYGDIHKRFNIYLDFSQSFLPKIHSELCPRASIINNGDIVLADASEDTDGVGKAIEVVEIPSHVNVVAGLHTILLRSSDYNFAKLFKGYLFFSHYIKKQTARIATGTKVYSLSKNTMKEITLIFPLFHEQQRIADCLSSLDELISLQSQKLELLKAHKKSLIQVLFPQEAENLPRLRFPEFENAGEWEEKKLGELADLIAEKSGKKNTS